MGADMIALAEQVEAALGPDRELDYRIALAKQGFQCGSFGTPEKWIKSAIKFGWAHPRFTSSLDAAMSLVPEGWAKYVADDEHGCHACVWDRGSPQTRGKTGGCKNAATPALALTAAALRARAAQEPK